MTKKRGNCYVASESLFHLLGGKKAGWKIMNLKHENDQHWYLINVNTNQILDPTINQFKCKPNYDEARGRGFLTSKPSKRAQKLIEHIMWGEDE